MKLYLVRHGETSWNKEGKLQGRTDIGLNEEGRKVAEWTSEGLKDVNFDIAFTSPLKRARQTAEIILKDRNIPIIAENRLIEFSFGTYEGSYKSTWDDNMKNFFRKIEDYVPTEGGESVEHALVRVNEFLQELIQNPKYRDSTILISTHGAALSAILTNIKKNPVPKFWEGGLHKNCGISIIEVTDGIPKIEQEAIVFY